MKRIWKIKCIRNGFTYNIFIETTEYKLHDYMETEIPDAISYIGATEKEVVAAKTLGLPIYIY